MLSALTDLRALARLEALSPRSLAAVMHLGAAGGGAELCEPPGRHAEPLASLRPACGRSGAQFPPRAPAGLRTAAGGTPSCRGSAAAGAGAAPPRARGGAPPPLAQQPAGTQQQGQHAQLRGRRGAATSAAATHAHAQEACPLPAAAFSSALDAGSALDFTWITHWQQQEARRAARRAVIDATRSRQRQRLRQVATLVAGSDAAAALRGAIGGSGGGAPHWAAEAALAGASAGSLDLPAASAQHPSDMDELTWVASHPPEGEAAAGAAGGTPLWSQQAAQQQQHIVGMGLGSAEGGPSGGASLAGPVTLRVGADTLSVRPLWIAVFQPEEGGPAK